MLGYSGARTSPHLWLPWTEPAVECDSCDDPDGRDDLDEVLRGAGRQTLEGLALTAPGVGIHAPVRQKPSGHLEVAVPDRLFQMSKQTNKQICSEGPVPGRTSRARWRNGALKAYWAVFVTFGTFFSASVKNSG
eukprot:101576-Prorocentrum_minimum.AAC.1